MKKRNLYSILVFISIIIFSNCKNSTNSDSTSNNDFEEIKIGNQIWMSENLNVDKFRNGDPIKEAKTHDEWIRAFNNNEPAWCYYMNDQSNGIKYGKLYNWYAINDARGLAPDGWHVPSDTEWNELIDFLGGKKVAGGKMKSKTSWAENGNGNNESGFNAKPSGYRLCDVVDFVYEGKSCGWWSTTQPHKKNSKSYDAWIRALNNEESSVGRSTTYGKPAGLSVRCRKD